MTAYLECQDKKKCTGCRTCELICPFNAIMFKQDEEGFIFPQINEEKCKKCGNCTKQCTYFNENYGDLLDKQNVFAVQIKDEEVLNKSSSGGAFTAFANAILDKGGRICGCTLDENFEAKHIFIDNKKELYKLRGSKYIQSDVNNTYIKTKENLENGIPILYVGTPCQIAGLKQFLKKDYDNLILIDLICHGVASEVYFKEYLKYLESKFNSKIIEYKFRDKSKYRWVGFGAYTYIKRNKKRKIYTLPEKDFFFNSYNSGKILRKCCYECKYATTKREGDITIADFWGIEKYHSNIDTENGVSAVILNTKKGKRIFENIKNNINYFPSELEYIINENGNFSKPSTKPLDRDYIFNDLYEKGFDYIAKRYFEKPGIVTKIKRAIPIGLKRTTKNIIRRFSK